MSDQNTRPTPSSDVAGLELAARFVEKRCADYIAEHGMYDGSTGVTEFPGNGDEWVQEWEEIAEGIRALTATNAKPVVPAEPVAWARQQDLERLARQTPGASSFQFANKSFAAWTVPLYAAPPSPVEGEVSAARKLAQYDLQIDRNAYPRGPMAEGRDMHRVIGWEGADRGGLLLSKEEAEAIRQALSARAALASEGKTDA